MPSRDPQENPHKSVRDAMWAVANARRGKPTEADRPKLSTFPMTPGARAAKRLARGE